MIKKSLLALVLIILAVLLIVNFWWQSQVAPVNQDQTKKAFVIQKGQGVSEIAKKLKTEELIRSELVFKIHVRQNDLTNKIQAGTFKISSAQNLKEIAEELTKNPEDLWVTLIEGWRIEEMAGELAKHFGDNSEEFVTNAIEGYMFPDTYLFPREATGEFIATTMRDTFDKRYSQDLKTKIKNQGLTEKEGVVLASLVEREGRSDKVRTEIAGILLKRFNMGMKLDVDATVQYLLGYQAEEKSWWKRHITKEDKEIKSPFNTYNNAGLPPSPICNPSLSSLNAVADADPKTPYLYYYHDSAGNSHYAKTLEEHTANYMNNP